MSGAEAAVTTTEYATSADGTRIAFDCAGSGPILVLVDGALSTREGARAMQQQLGSDFTVVAYDRRGRGESGDTRPYAVEREIDDLRAVIDEVGGAAYVLGQSSGAGLAYRAAAAGVPMRAVAGYEAPWVGQRLGPDGKPLDYVGDLDRMIAAGENGKAVDYFMVKMVKGPWFMPVMLRSMRKVWKKLLALAPTLPNDARIMGGDFEAPVDELARIRIPTLAVVGSKAAPEMRKAQEAVAASVPAARFEVLEGQTHMVAPDVLGPVVVEFFGR